MMSINRITRSALWLASSLLVVSAATAQQKPQLLQQPGNSYDVTRETVLTGTVVSFTEGTTRAGSHLILNTSSGVTDVNVGNAKLLSLNGMTFSPGESVRITGENVTVAGSALFAARIIQKGSQSLTVRSERGFMARPTRTNVPASALKQGGAL
jgi:DNA/RNA endonuclease YhcR with UshA esterase domain